MQCLTFPLKRPHNQLPCDFDCFTTRSGYRVVVGKGIKIRWHLTGYLAIAILLTLSPDLDLVVVGKGSSIALADCQFFKGKVTHSSNGKVWMRKNATQIRDFNKNVLIHNFKTISCLVSLFHLLRFPYDQSDPDLIQQLVAIGIWGDSRNKIMVKLILTLWRRVFKCSLQIRLYFVPTQTLFFTNVMDSSAWSARF